MTLYMNRSSKRAEREALSQEQEQMAHAAVASALSDPSSDGKGNKTDVSINHKHPGDVFFFLNTVLTQGLLDHVNLLLSLHIFTSHTFAPSLSCLSFSLIFALFFCPNNLVPVHIYNHLITSYFHSCSFRMRGVVCLASNLIS